MGVPNATRQAAADGMKAHAGGSSAYVSVHTGAGGGTTGTNEATGGGYARQAAALSSGTTGIVNASTVNVPVAAGTYTEGGLWSAASGGTFVGSAPFSGGNVVVSGAGASIDVTAALTA